MNKRMCALPGPGLVKVKGSNEWVATKIKKTMCGLMVDMFDYRRRGNTYGVISVAGKQIAVPHTRAKLEKAAIVLNRRVNRRKKR